MEERSAEYLSYLLRLWRTSQDNPWRASLEDPRTGERVGFGSLEALWAFLRGQSEATLHEDASEEDQECQEHSQHFNCG